MFLLLPREIQDIVISYLPEADVVFRLRRVSRLCGDRAQFSIQHRWGPSWKIMFQKVNQERRELAMPCEKIATIFDSDGTLYVCTTDGGNGCVLYVHKFDVNDLPSSPHRIFSDRFSDDHMIHLNFSQRIEAIQFKGYILDCRASNEDHFYYNCRGRCALILPTMAEHVTVSSSFNTVGLLINDKLCLVKAMSSTGHLEVVECFSVYLNKPILLRLLLDEFFLIIDVNQSVEIFDLRSASRTTIDLPKLKESTHFITVDHRLIGVNFKSETLLVLDCETRVIHQSIIPNSAMFVCSDLHLLSPTFICCAVTGPVSGVLILSLHGGVRRFIDNISVGRFAIHPNKSMIIAFAEGLSSHHHPLLQALESGIATCLTFTDHDLHSQNSAMGLWLIIGLSSLVLASVFSWISTSLIYDGWLTHIQNLF